MKTALKNDPWKHSDGNASFFVVELDWCVGGGMETGRLIHVGRTKDGSEAGQQEVKPNPACPPGGDTEVVEGTGTHQHVIDRSISICNEINAQTPILSASKGWEGVAVKMINTTP